MLITILEQSTLEPTLRSLYHSTFDASVTRTDLPFAADLIISAPNVPCHVSIAELLGLPIHILSSTCIAGLIPDTETNEHLATPYSPTVTLPHPRVIVQRSNANASLTNYLSYPIYENQYVSFADRYIITSDDPIGFGIRLEESSTSSALPAWAYQLSARWMDQVFWTDWKYLSPIAGVPLCWKNRRTGEIILVSLKTYELVSC